MEVVKKVASAFAPKTTVTANPAAPGNEVKADESLMKKAEAVLNTKADKLAREAGLEPGDVYRIENGKIEIMGQGNGKHDIFLDTKQMPKEFTFENGNFIPKE